MERLIEIRSSLSDVRSIVFWPPAVILVAAMIASLLNYPAFLSSMTALNDVMLATFGWAFTFASFAAVILCAVVYISPIGSVKIGGQDAKPIFKKWNWFAITLCTTIATGILFWATAEPMFHVNNPPAFSGVEPGSEAAKQFALSTMFLHWSITPYAIYAVPSLAFALAYYNKRGRYSLGAPLKIVIGKKADGPIGGVIDMLALFALVVGVAASLGAGVLTLVGGLEKMTPLVDTRWMRLAITIAIVMVYVSSSVSGLQRGIKILSDINVRFFFILAAFVLVFGPTSEMLVLSLKSGVTYIKDFVPNSVGWGGRLTDSWTMDWTVFFFANWLAWAPITALFLGRIAVGYTVREFLVFNLVVPALFSIFWMSIFGASAILLNEESGGALADALSTSGPEAVLYAMLDQLPFVGLTAAAFMFAVFVSFVTAMDSNTHSISGVCLKSSLHNDGSQSDMRIKIFWGILIGLVSWLMTATNGIDGIRMLSNLGGGPGLLILIGCGAALIVSIVKGRTWLNHPHAPAIS